MPKQYTFPISIFRNLPPRNVSEILRKITHRSQSKTRNIGTHTKSNVKHFLFSHLRVSVTSADYCASPLTQNTTVSVQGISPKRVPTEASCLARIKPPGMQLKPGKNQTANLEFFTPAKNPKRERKTFCFDVKR